MAILGIHFSYRVMIMSPHTHNFQIPEKGMPLHWSHVVNYESPDLVSHYLQ